MRNSMYFLFHDYLRKHHLEMSFNGCLQKHIFIVGWKIGFALLCNIFLERGQMFQQLLLNNKKIYNREGFKGAKCSICRLVLCKAANGDSVVCPIFGHTALTFSSVKYDFYTWKIVCNKCEWTVSFEIVLAFEWSFIIFVAWLQHLKSAS